jgi:hypothetical protein
MMAWPGFGLVDPPWARIYLVEWDTGVSIDWCGGMAGDWDAGGMDSPWLGVLGDRAHLVSGGFSVCRIIQSMYHAPCAMWPR